VFNLARLLDRNAERHSDRAAVIMNDAVFSHAEFNSRVHAVSAGLQSAGVSHGDIVAILLDNCVEFLEASFAVNGAGAIFLPLNTRLAADELSYILGHAQCRGLIVGDRFADMVPELRRRCPSLALVVGVDAQSPGIDFRYSVMVQGHLGVVRPFASVDRADISRLMYTSGTTARPKGVPLTYDNVLWKIFDHIVEFGLTAADRTLMAGPMYHVGCYDLPGIGTLYAGGSLAIVPKFDAVAVLSAVGRYGITNVWLAPAMLNAILQVEEPEKFDNASLRFVTNGGEKMPVSLIRRFQSLFPNAWLADSFGMTETASGDTVLDPDHVIDKLGSVGRPLLHVEARVVGPDDADMPPGKSGELLLRGPKVFGGYWRDPDATRAAFTGGWFRTGDVAHFDADGYLFIDDRKKDMIISGGENVASPEVERVLYNHPSVLEAAVVGMPDERWGEVPKAVVVLRPGASVSAADLIEFCRAHLARYKVPRRVEFIDALPRTPSGKVLKRELK
jgi:fatty-acyl-CoA synthase